MSLDDSGDLCVPQVHLGDVEPVAAPRTTETLAENDCVGIDALGHLRESHSNVVTL